MKRKKISNMRVPNVVLSQYAPHVYSRRLAFYGGRAEWRPAGDLNVYYDISSSYPKAMLDAVVVR